MKEHAIAIVLLLGFGSVLYGLWMIERPLAFIFGGLVVMLCAVIVAYDHMRSPERR